MFMFRSKRTILTKQLVKARKRRAGDEARRAFEEDSKGLAELLKKLKDNQLEMLLTAVESRGQSLSNCVLMSREYDPHVLCCQTWRWPEVRHGAEIRRIPSCRSAADPVYVCCNPYHWSRLYQPGGLFLKCRRHTVTCEKSRWQKSYTAECPPPPYSHCAMDTFKPEDRAPSEAPLVCRDSFPGSLTTNGEESSLNSRAWCRLAYWEMTKRVGPLFPVDPMCLNVFGDIPCGDGLSLKQLAQHSFSPPESVSKTRCKIGLGVTLSHEDDGIWVYNRSENPVFVNSLTLENPELQSAPTRVPAEHCLCVFDPVKAAHQNYGWDFAKKGPVDRNSVQISFVKGWGPGYSRREITSCPCWLEILLAPCR